MSYVSLNSKTIKSILEDINVNNVNDVVYAQRLVRQRKRENIQRRF